METPIQKAIKMCDDIRAELEIQSRINYEDTIPRIDMIELMSGELKSLILYEKEIINQIYSNCEKIKLR